MMFCDHHRRTFCENTKPFGKRIKIGRPPWQKII